MWSSRSSGIERSERELHGLGGRASARYALDHLAGKDPDRRPASRLRTACRRGHHLPEAPGDDRAAAFGEEPPHLLRAALVLGPAADDGDLDIRHREIVRRWASWNGGGGSATTCTGALRSASSRSA